MEAIVDISSRFQRAGDGKGLWMNNDNKKNDEMMFSDHPVVPEQLLYKARSGKNGICASFVITGKESKRDVKQKSSCI